MKTPPPAVTPMLTVDAVAQRLGLSPKTIRRAITDKQLPSYRFGRALRVSEDDLGPYIGRPRK